MLSISESGISSSREKYPKGGFYGKYHSDDHKKYMSELMKEKTKGSMNSQYGTMWISNGIDNKKIQKDSIIPEGWHKGRKIK